jgi:hypothetical protein
MIMLSEWRWVLRSWQRLELPEFKPIRKQSSSQGNHRLAGNSGATREESLAKLYALKSRSVCTYAVVVAKGAETWV